MSIQKRFVRTILQDESRRLLKNQSLALHRKLHFHTQRLYNSRQITVRGGDNLDGELTFSHLAYLRFLDLKSLNYGEKTVTHNRKIHNRFVFGHYYSIANRLMNDFTDDVVAQFREQTK